MSAEHEDVAGAGDDLPVETETDRLPGPARLPGPFTRRRPEPDSPERLERDVPRADFHRGRARELRETMRTRHAVPAKMLEDHDEHVFYEAVDVIDVALRDLPVGTFAHEEIAAALTKIRRAKVDAKKAG